MSHVPVDEVLNPPPAPSSKLLPPCFITLASRDSASRRRMGVHLEGPVAGSAPPACRRRARRRTDQGQQQLVAGGGIGAELGHAVDLSSQGWSGGEHAEQLQQGEQANPSLCNGAR